MVDIVKAGWLQKECKNYSQNDKLKKYFQLILKYLSLYSKAVEVILVCVGS